MDNNKLSINNNPQKKQGLAIVSMSLGIVILLLTTWFPLATLLGFISLSLGIVALIKNQGGMALAGITLSILAILIGLLLGTSNYINKITNEPNCCNIKTSASESKSLKQEKGNKKYSKETKEGLNIYHHLGETINIIDNNEIYYTITINSVTKMNNNQHPNSIVINYTCHNINKDSDCYISNKNFKIIDSFKAVGKHFTPENETTDSSSIPKGESRRYNTYFKLKNESDTIDIILSEMFGKQLAKWQVNF